MFTVSRCQYSQTDRGVYASGDIAKNGVKVGTFRQEPFAACVPSFDLFAVAEEFRRIAGVSGTAAFCERLLCKWESRTK